MKFPLRLLTIGAASLALAATTSPATAAQQPVTQFNAASPTASTVDAGGDVTVTMQLGPDSVRVGYYIPAPGVTPSELVASLRSQGLPAEIDSAVAGRQSPLGDPDPCSRYNTAYTFDHHCSPYVRWSRGSNAVPYVYFRDFSSSAWPVGRAVTKWNESPYIAPRYITGSCPADTHCVSVTSANYGETLWVAEAYVDYNPTTRYIFDTRTSVRFNDYFASRYNEYTRQGVACHEIGHVLGLDHNSSHASCLYSTVLSSNKNYPSSDDYNLIRYKIYPR